MKRIRSFLSGVFFLALVALLVFAALSFFTSNRKEQTADPSAPKPVDLVAIGDSLTEGVGDSLSIGGYVPRVAEMIEENEAVSQVSIQNFGVSGNTSAQILERMNTLPEIEAAVKEAEIVVLTVGGNDVIKTFKKELLNVQLESFIEPLHIYQENLMQILQLIQKWNPETVVYVFGIYNPYDIYFAEIAEMQLILDKWNQTTQELTENFSQVTFVPIDTAFTSTRVLSDSTTDDASTERQEVYENPYLYEDDLFHPNEDGYRKMASILYTQMKKNLPFLDK